MSMPTTVPHTTCHRNAGKKTTIFLLRSDSMTAKGGKSPQAHMNKLVAELKLKYPVIASDVSVLADRPPRKAKPKWPIQSKLTSAAHDDALHFVVGCRMEDVTQDLSSGSSLWPLLQANRVDVELVPKGLGMKELVGQVRDLVLGYYGLCEPKQDV